MGKHVICVLSALIAFFFLTSGSSLAGGNSYDLGEMLNRYEIVGEGPNLLSIKCILPSEGLTGLSFHALALDPAGLPLRKVSGFSSRGIIDDSNEILFYLFYFTPSHNRPQFQASAFIRFIIKRGGETYKERIVTFGKVWGKNKKAKPLIHTPPHAIHGRLLLKDFTFHSDEDIRKPDGYYIKGQITGENGRWTSFSPTSDITDMVDIVGEEPWFDRELSTEEGWLELTTGNRHAMKDAVSPTKPYIKGCWDKNGYFHPYPTKLKGKR
jgi:hypothetical protein